MTDLAAKLQSERFVSLATFRRDGREVRTPVWFVNYGGLLGAYAERSSGKVKRLRNSSRSRVAACNMRGKVRGEWFETRALLVEGDEAEPIKKALRAKYGFQITIANVLSRLSGKHANRQYMRIEPARD